MAEPLSIAASIAGLVSLADVVVCRMVKYVRTTMNAKEHISALLAETLNLHGVLRSLELLTRQYEDEAAVYTQAHHLFSCYLSLNRLRELLEKADPAKRSSSLKAFKDILHWPLSKPDTDRFVDELERHKSTLTLALSADSLANILKALSRQQEIGEDVKEIKHEIRKQQKRIDVYMDAKEQEKLMAFLGTVDPTRNQKIGLDLLQPGTGLWFTEGEELKWWLATENAKLWVYGIPGAGKTVLMALIIKTIQDTVPQEAGMAYFYCDYKSIETQRPLNIMGSLVKQLALQDSDAFEKLRGFYEDHQQGRNASGLLSAESLRDLLVEMSQCFDDTLIVIDGLDECNSKDRGLVMELLSSLNASCSNSIKMLFASRDESDIRSALANYKVISIAAQSSDLRIYVAAEIQSRIDKNLLRLRSTSIKEHIMNRLVEKADGMFRWVTCQIDYICQLPNDRERSKALESLPPTLAATYDRILDRVNKSNAINQNMVQRTLRWVGCGCRLSLAQLAEAISVEPGDQHMDQDTVFDENSILSWCSSLIRVSRGFLSHTDIVEFAHFTVNEYLNDIDPQSGSPFGPYSIQDEDTIELELAQTCLTYLCFDNFANDYPKNYEEYKSLIDLRPFSTYTARLWQHHCIRDAEIPDLGNEEILNLSCHLFRPSKSNNFMTLLQICYYAFPRHRGIVLRDGVAPCAVDCSTLHWACLYSYPELCRHLVNRGADVNKASSLGSPLRCAIMSFYSAFDFEQHGRVELNPRAIWTSPIEGDEHYHIDNTTKILDILFGAGATLDFTSQIVRQPDASPVFSAFGMALLNEPFPGRWTRKFLERGIICDRQDLEIIFGSPRYLQLPTLRRLIDLIGNKNIKAEDRGWFAEMVLSRTSVCPKSLPINLPSEETLQEQQHLLTSAARAGQDEIVKKLLTQHHVSPNADDGDESPLHWAVLNNFPGVVETLISFGANAYQLRAIAGTMATPLHVATKHQDVKILNRLLAVAERVENDSSGLSVMHTAARNGNFAAVQLLHQHCQDHCIQLTHRTSDGRTPLLCAAESGSVEIMQFLIDKTDASILSDRSTDDSTATHFAAQSESPTAALKFLIEHDPTQVNQPNAADCSPLHYLLEQRPSDATYSAAKMLLEKGADIASKDKHGTSCLFKAFELWSTEVADQEDTTSSSASNFAPLLTSLLHVFLDQPQCREVVSIQVAGKQPLTLAIQKQDEALVQKLLNLRCSVDERDEDDEGYTSLEQACVAGCSSDLFEQLLHQSKMNANQQRATCGCNLLHLAASEGHVNLMKVLLGSQLDIDERTTCSTRHASDGRYYCWINVTALMVAASQDRLPVMKMLVQEGADCNATDYYGFTALHYASGCGNLEAVKLLESERLVSQDTARYNYVDDGWEDLTPCHVAVLNRSYHLVNHFFATYAFVNGNYTTRSGVTLLHVAAYNGDSPLLKLLLSKNSQVNAAKKDQWTALHYASAKGHSDAIQVLLDCGADPGQKTLGGMTAELLAIRKGHLQIAKTLREACSKLVLPKEGDMSLSGEKHFNEMTQALFDAIWKGDFQFCERLLDEGAEVNGTDLQYEGGTPLMRSLGYGQLKIARLLLQRGANSRGRLLAGPCKGWTSIHFAASCQDAGILTALLEQGPSDAMTDPVTPLHIAAANGHLACVKTILDHNAITTRQKVVSDKDHRGRQPLCLGVTPGLEPAPIDGVRKGQPISDREIPSIINSVIHLANLSWAWQLTPSTNTNSSFTDGTALHIAVDYEHAGVVDLLLKRGADMEATSSAHKQTPLHHAAHIGSVPAVELLIRAHANVNCRDMNGGTPFMIASEEGHVDVLDELFANGADVLARDFAGQQALHWGMCSNDLNVISRLMAYGLKFNSPDFHGYCPLYDALYSRDKNLESFVCDFTALSSFFEDRPPRPSRSLISKATVENRPLILKRMFEKMKAQDSRHIIDNASRSSPPGPPALHEASLRGNLECIMLLVEAGANMEILWGDYGTPLGSACTMGRLEAVQYLIGQGAKTSWLGSDGNVTGAIQKASQHKRIVEWLLERSAGGDSALEAEISPPESIASVIQKQRIRNQRHWEVSDAIQGHNCSDNSRIRRRNSFIYEYVIPHSFPPSEPTESMTRLTLEKKPGAQLEGDHLIRETNFQVYENAIYRKRSLLPEERYFLYPLAPLTMRDSSTSPWVMF